MRRFLLVLSAVLLLAAPATEARPEPEPGFAWGTLLEEWADHLVGDLLAVFRSDPGATERVPTTFTAAGSGSGGEIGPHMDPDGATPLLTGGGLASDTTSNDATEPPDGGESGPHMDPDG